jgi:hypothetical protein
MEKVIIPGDRTGCWYWTAHTGKRPKKNYGYCSRASFPDQMAHRTSWILFKGSIPKGLHVLHKCDNPPCVNPEHLYVGTNRQNVEDRVNRGLGTHLPGESNPSAKLTEEQVAEIRKLYVKGKPGIGIKIGSTQWLALKFSVGKSTIKRIIRKHSWKT